MPQEAAGVAISGDRSKRLGQGIGRMDDDAGRGGHNNGTSGGPVLDRERAGIKR